MSEPIMEWLKAALYGASQNSIPLVEESWREIFTAVAALRERAERAESTLTRVVEWAHAQLRGLSPEHARNTCKHLLDHVIPNSATHRSMQPLDELKRRIADLEAERAALMAAGAELVETVLLEFGNTLGADEKLAAEIFKGTPGALEAWMKRDK